MRHFLLLAHSVDVMPLLNAVHMQPELWNQENIRTVYPDTPHALVDDILLRFNDLEAFKKSGNPVDIIDGHESIPYPAWHLLPQARVLVFDLMRRVEAVRLGRVMITRLAPGKRILPHVDGGDHAAYFRRYHICLQNLPGSLIRAGDETVTMRQGEAWWFDNAAEHEVINNSADDRLTLIIDVRL